MMKELLAADPAARKLCGVQQPKRDTAYRLSRYCFRTPCEEGCLLYHTMTGALLLLPQGERIEDHRDALIAAWFLVPEAYDERKQADDLRTVARLLKPPKKNITAFTIVTTTDCNARCFYCYERGTRRFSMDTDTAHAVAAYIARACGGEAVSLTWFGGEPLFNIPAIDTICADLRERGISFRSYAVSNGSLLDPETVRKARELWNLYRVQITIDGTEAVYNRTKAYVQGGENAYARVLGNIADALEHGIEVTLRLNLHPDNAEDLLRLCDELGDRFAGKPGVRTQVITLKDAKGTNVAFSDKALSNRCFCAVSERLRERGVGTIDAPVRGIDINRCKADNPNTEAIYPDGTVGRCENYDPDEITGSIYAEERDQAVAASWKERILFPACDTCLHYPHCIKLRKCFWDTGDCTAYERERRTYVLRQQILALYHERKDAEAGEKQHE